MYFAIVSDVLRGVAGSVDTNGGVGRGFGESAIEGLSGEGERSVRWC
jgi:hypothetical protein